MNIKKYLDKYSNFTINNTDVQYYSTYIEQMDYILEGGFPQGKIIEIFGHEGSGKSTLLSYIFAKHTHEKNKFVVLIDTEGSIYSLDTLRNMGFNLENTLLLSLSEGEKIFDIIEELILDNRCCMIGIDSIACIISSEEVNGQDTIGSHARMLSRRVKMLISAINSAKSKTTIIFINQLRSKINDAWKGEFTTTTTGGKAMKYYASIRIKVERADYIKNNRDDKIGFTTILKVEKSRTSKPQIQCLIPFIYGQGVRQELYYLELAIDKSIISKSGAWFVINLDEKNTHLLDEYKVSKIKFQGKFDLIHDVCNNVFIFNLIKALLKNNAGQ